MLKLVRTAAMTSLAALSLTATLGGVAHAKSAPQFQTAQASSLNANRNRNNNDQVLGGVVGAVAGGVIGSQVAGNGSRTEGTVLGALVGGVLGASIADNNRSRGFSNRRSFGTGFNRSRSFSGSRFRNDSFGYNGYSSGGFSSFSSPRGYARSPLARSNRFGGRSRYVVGRF